MLHKFNIFWAGLLLSILSQLTDMNDIDGQ